MTSSRLFLLACFGFCLAAACSSEAGPAPGPDASAPSADFTLTVIPDRLAVLQGGTATLEVAVSRTNGFAGPITLEPVGLPGGTSLAPVTIASGQQAVTLTVTASAAAPHSLPTPVTIRGTSGGLEVSRSLTVTVYGRPGSLDTSFSGGKVLVPVGRSDDYAHALAVQSDGKILLAGRSAERLGDFAVVRLDRDGTLDPSFGAGGKVTTDLGGRSDTAQAIAVQPDGKIVVAGTTSNAGTGQDFAVVRYDAAGGLDATFGTGGKVSVSFGNDSDSAYALLLQVDGKIVVGGDTNQGTNAGGVDFALARLLPDGTLDPGFGSAGKVVTTLASHAGRDSIYALAFQEIAGEARLVAAGGEGDFTAARYTSAGQLDPTFGDGGKVTRLLGSVIGAARAVKVTTAGQILLAGHHTHDFALVRLTAGGQPDPAFGTAGKVVTAVSASNWDEIQGLALEADGNIVAGGWAYEQTSSSGNFVVARYGPDGRLDATFGEEGLVLTEMAPPRKADQVTAILLQTDERVPAVRVLAAGYASPGDSDFAVARYWR